ncbi:MAG: hypothetical protein RJB39_633 [Candidatus Parcubacteria bacterium]|jgi:hypothetical protein
MKKIILLLILAAVVILGASKIYVYNKEQSAQAFGGRIFIKKATATPQVVEVGGVITITVEAARSITEKMVALLSLANAGRNPAVITIPLTKVSVGNSDTTTFTAQIAATTPAGIYTFEVADQDRKIGAPLPKLTITNSILAPVPTTPALPIAPTSVAQPTQTAPITPSAVVTPVLPALPAVATPTISTQTAVAGQVPTITAITPTEGGAGTRVTITGTGFSTARQNTILFNGKTGSAMANLAAVNNMLTFTVTDNPLYNECAILWTAGCDAGWENLSTNKEYSVTVKNNNGTSNTVKYGHSSPVVQGREVQVPVIFPTVTTLREGDTIKFKWTPPTGLTGNDRVEDVTVRMVAYGYDEQEAGNGGRKLGGSIIGKASVDTGEIAWRVQVPDIKDESGTGPYKLDYLQQYTFQVDFNQKTQYYNQRSKDVLSQWGPQKYRLSPSVVDTRPYLVMRIPIGDNGGAVAATPGYESDFIFPKTYPFKTGDTISQVPIMNFKLHSLNAASVVQSVELADWSLDSNSINKSTAFASKLYLYDGNTLIATADSQSKKFIFTGFSISIPKDGVKTLMIKGDFPNTVANNSWAKFELKTVKYKSVNSSTLYSAAPHRASGKRALDITWLASSPLTFTKTDR